MFRLWTAPGGAEARTRLRRQGSAAPGAVLAAAALAAAAGALAAAGAGGAVAEWTGMPVASGQSSGQELAGRVAGVRNGTVRLTYATREGVEICAQGIRLGDRRMMWHSRGWDEDVAYDCRTGSAEAELLVQEGSVRAVEILLSARDRTAGAADLGMVPPGEAVRFFLELARGSEGGREKGDFILPAYLADVEEVWRDLLVLARDRNVAQRARTALFWLAQSKDERVPAFFEAILLRKGGG